GGVAEAERRASQVENGRSASHLPQIEDREHQTDPHRQTMIGISREIDGSKDREHAAEREQRTEPERTGDQERYRERRGGERKAQHASRQRASGERARTRSEQSVQRDRERHAAGLANRVPRLV